MTDPLDYIAAEVIENNRLLTRMQEIVCQPGRHVTVVGMLPDADGDTTVYFRIVSPPEPITLNVMRDFSFKLDDFRDDIMDAVKDYAKEYAESLPNDGSDPPIDDALLDAIESTIKEGTGLWTAKK